MFEIRNTDCECVLREDFEGIKIFSPCKDCDNRSKDICSRFENFKSVYGNVLIPYPFDRKIMLSDGKNLLLEYDISRIGRERWIRGNFYQNEPLEWWIEHLTKFEIF